jgi:hypothetical protein
MNVTLHYRAQINVIRQVFRRLGSVLLVFNEIYGIIICNCETTSVMWLARKQICIQNKLTSRSLGYTRYLRYLKQCVYPHEHALHLMPFGLWNSVINNMRFLIWCPQNTYASQCHLFYNVYIHILQETEVPHRIDKAPNLRLGMYQCACLVRANPHLWGHGTWV